jgi:hypothetical protein
MGRHERACSRLQLLLGEACLENRRLHYDAEKLFELCLILPFTSFLLNPFMILLLAWLSVLCTDSTKL